jgi:hypothetical protein
MLAFSDVSCAGSVPSATRTSPARGLSPARPSIQMLAFSDVSCAGSVPNAPKVLTNSEFFYSDASIRGRLLRGVCPQRDGCDWDLLAFADASCAGSVPSALAFADASCAGSVPSAQHDRDLLAFADVSCAGGWVPGTLT